MNDTLPPINSPNNNINTECYDMTFGKQGFGSGEGGTVGRQRLELMAETSELVCPKMDDVIEGHIGKNEVLRMRRGSDSKNEKD